MNLKTALEETINEFAIKYPLSCCGMRAYKKEIKNTTVKFWIDNEVQYKLIDARKEQLKEVLCSKTGKDINIVLNFKGKEIKPKPKTNNNDFDFIYSKYNYLKEYKFEEFKDKPLNVLIEEMKKHILPLGDKFVSEIKMLGTFNMYKTVYWRTISQYIRAKRLRCSKCGATDNLEVHHSDYETLMGRELNYLEDEKRLVVLCSKCHKKQHNRR